MEKSHKVYCPNCSRHTNHDLREGYKYTYRQEDYPDMGIDYASGEWSILQCRGCDNVRFKEWFLTSEDYDLNGAPFPSVRFYPPAEPGNRDVKTYFALPSRLRDLYVEVIYARNMGHRILCASGLRSLVEGICNSKKVRKGPVLVNGKVVQKRNLEGKINGLHEASLIPKRHAEILHNLRFLGNEAVHDLAIATLDELNTAIDVIEHTIESAFELEEKGATLKAWKSRRDEK